MNRMQWTGALAIIAALATVVSVRSQVQIPGASRPGWEYKSLIVVTSGAPTAYLEDGRPTTVSGGAPGVVDKINGLGREGWELAGVSSASGAVGYWFKRQLLR